MGSLEGWFRAHYNLAPTDPRFLNATVEDMKVDYWFHELAARMRVAHANDLPVRTLDEVLAGVTVEERFAALKKQGAQAPGAPEGERETAGQETVAEQTAETEEAAEEVIIDYAAPQ